MGEITWISTLAFAFSCCVNVSWQTQIDVSADFMETLVNRVKDLELKLAKQVDLGHQQKIEFNQQKAELHQQQNELDQQKIELGQQKAELHQQQIELGQQKTELNQQMVEFKKIKTELSEMKSRYISVFNFLSIVLKIY